MAVHSVFSLILLAAFAGGLGINCDGSSLCSEPSLFGCANTLSSVINGIDETRFYADGEQIACCDGAVCAFLQETDGGTGAEIKSLAPFITQHGCTVCGSVPTGFPETNDVSQGQLTFNFVSSPCVSDTALC